MEDMNIIRALYFGDYLSDSDMKRGDYILEQLQEELKKRVKNDYKNN